MQIGGVFLWTQ